MKGLAELTDEELSEKRKKARSADITNAVILGILVGISIYGIVKNGFGFWSLLPLFFALFAANKWKKNKALERELKSRKLK